MATTGLEYVICAPYIETAGVVTYGPGMIVTHAIKADLSINLNDVILYADNKIDEAVKEFKDGKITINGSYLEYTAQAMLLGHEIVEGKNDDPDELVARGDDSGAFVGTGFFATVMRNNVQSYRAIWLPKVKYGVPNESLETKADSIKFGTPTIEGTVMTDADGVWKYESMHETRTDAISWLNDKANITE